MARDTWAHNAFAADIGNDENNIGNGGSEGGGPVEFWVDFTGTITNIDGNAIPFNDFATVIEEKSTTLYMGTARLEGRVSPLFLISKYSLFPDIDMDQYYTFCGISSVDLNANYQITITYRVIALKRTNGEHIITAGCTTLQ